MKKLLLPLLCLYGSHALADPFSDLGLNHTVAAISGNGNVVVGRLVGENGYGNGLFSYRWEGGTSSVITFAGVSNAPKAITTSGGKVMGMVYGAGYDGSYTAQNGTVTQGYFNDWYGGNIAGISGDGQRVTGSDNYYNDGRYAFIDDANGKVKLGDLAGGAKFSEAYGISGDGNTVIGQSDSTSGMQAFRWTQAGGMVGLGDLSGGSFSSTAKASSNDGLSIVGAGTSSAGPEAFLWTVTNGMVGLGDLAGGAFDSSALSISGDGSTIVGYGTAAAGKKAVAWDSIHGIRDLQTLATGLGMDLTGWNLFGANDVSDDGLVIAGEGQYLGENHGWILDFRAMGYSSFSEIPTAVPLPATAWLFGASLAGLVLTRRRHHA